MGNSSILCPGCGVLVELKILIIKDDGRRCARQCIVFAHRHQIPNHHVVEVTTHESRDAADQVVMLDARALCSWSGALVILVDHG